MEILKEIKEELAGIEILFNEPLKQYTYTKVGGAADYLAFPRNQYELKRIVTFANARKFLGWSWGILPILSSVTVGLKAL